jgi:NDP-sugar pyrophosphorylase family protein
VPGSETPSPQSPDLPLVCILAGGLGSRLGEVTSSVPKPILEVAGQPFLVHQLQMLADQGCTRVLLCVGYKGDRIEKVIGRTCAGVEIAYSYDGPGLDGTLGALRRARHLLNGRFLVMYGDTYLTLNFTAFNSGWRDSMLPGGMTVIRNEGRWDRSNVVFSGDRVELYDKRLPTAAMRWIDYGLGALTVEALDLVGEEVTDLSDLYHVMSVRGLLFGYEVNDRFYEIGTPSALEETTDYLSSRGTSGTSPSGST